MHSDEVVEDVARGRHLADLRDHALVMRVRHVGGQRGGVLEGRDEDDVAVGFQALGSLETDGEPEEITRLLNEVADKPLA